MSDAPIVLITGVMAAGKSSVAQALAESLPKSVHVRGDVFRRMIVNNGVDMTPNPSDSAMSQLRLRYRMTATAARAYAAAGFHAIVQDVIVGPVLAEVLALYDADVCLVVLCPDKSVVAAREAARHKTGYRDFSIDAFDELLRQETPRLGHWIDSSHLSVDETVSRIRALLSTEAN